MTRLATLLSLAGAALGSVTPVAIRDNSAFTTASIILPFGITDSYDASIVAVDATATTYAIGCPPEDQGCSMQQSETFTQGPFTFEHSGTLTGVPCHTESPYVEQDHCQLDPKADLATCWVVDLIPGSDSKTTPTTQEVTTIPYLSFMAAIRITAGQEKLSGTASVNNGSTAVATSTSLTARPSSGLGTAAATSTSSSTTATPGKNAAGRIYPQAGFIGSIAAAVVFAMML